MCIRDRVVPLVLTVFLPTVAVVTLHTAPEEAADFQKLLALLPVASEEAGMERQLLNLLLNYVLPDVYKRQAPCPACG